MKRAIGATLVTVSLGISAWAAPPALGPGVPVEADGKPINVKIGHLVPAVADWNGDGKKDLIVGQFDGGRIRLYLNTGTDAAPAFAGFSGLQAGGAEIRLPAG